MSFTPDEIIATLQRSSLPTVLVEGRDDMIIYRQMERLLKGKKVDFLECGGRNTLLKVYERRNEIKNLTIFFIADKDMWVFSNTPVKYQNIFFTNGYSLENDLYNDGKILLDDLLDADELLIKNQLLDNVLMWFAFEIELYLANTSYNNEFAKISLLNEKVIAKNDTHFKTDFLSDRNYKPPQTDFLNHLKNNYATHLRGKFLFQLYTKIFEHHRKVKYKDGTAFSTAQLFELCYREGIKRDNSCMKRIINALEQHF